MPMDERARVPPASRARPALRPESPPGSPAGLPVVVDGDRLRGFAPPPPGGFAFVRSTLLAVVPSTYRGCDLSSFSQTAPRRGQGVAVATPRPALASVGL